MVEITRRSLPNNLVEITAVVPADRADAVEEAIREACEPSIPAREAFPDSTPGKVLRGARGLREMTQAALAARIGVHKTHISEMERGLRPSGKAMAKRLAAALDFPWKAFL